MRMVDLLPRRPRTSRQGQAASQGLGIFALRRMGYIVTKRCVLVIWNRPRKDEVCKSQMVFITSPPGRLTGLCWRKGGG